MLIHYKCLYLCRTSLETPFRAHTTDVRPCRRNHTSNPTHGGTGVHPNVIANLINMNLNKFLKDHIVGIGIFAILIGLVTNWLWEKIAAKPVQVVEDKNYNTNNYPSIYQGDTVSSYLINRILINSVDAFEPGDDIVLTIVTHSSQISCYALIKNINNQYVRIYGKFNKSKG